MSKAKIAAILAALISILTGVLYLIDDDPATQPDVPAIVEEVSGAVGAVRGPVEVPVEVEPAPVVEGDEVAPAPVDAPMSEVK